MTVTRAELIKRGVRRFGGYSGSISSGTSTAAMLSGLIDTLGDDSALAGNRLFMFEAATEADRERTITRWDDSIGMAHFEKARSDTTYTSETFAVVRDYSLTQWRNAVNKALTASKRSYRYVLPLVHGVDVYSMDRLTWLEGADDIDEVLLCQSPNMLHNDEFEYWQNGSALAPDGWTLAGSGASVARASTGIASPYAATVTRASADATLYQDVPPSLVQYLTRSTSAPLPVVAFGAWVTSSTASIARVGVYNGSSTTWSSYYTLTSGVPVFLSSTYQTTATDTALRLVLSVDTSAGAATFHRAIMIADSTIPTQLKDRGSYSYHEEIAHAVKRNQGGLPVVELASPYAPGQLVIVSRRPFAEMSADTDTVEDQYADMLEEGMVRWITDAHAPNQDRERIDRIRGEAAAKWSRALKKNVSKPVQPPSTQVRISGA